MTGQDMHKPGRPEKPGMGGIAMVVGFVGAVLAGLVLHSFFGFQLHLTEVLAALLTVCIVAIIGIFDDMFDMAQRTKALLPLAAAVPLVAVAVAGGHNAIAIPFVGTIDFGLAYPLLLVPLAVAVCSNLTNMLAGWNGTEAGLGLVMFATLAIVAYAHGQVEMTVLCVAMVGALLGFIPYNWYPARVFIDDVGTLSIGAALAAAVIVSDLKSAGAILTIPFVIDFFIKAANGFPKSFSELGADGKLHAPKGKIRGLGDLVLRVSGGLSERNLTLALIGIECVFAVIVLALYLK
ncbi:Phospho-N-acetylmuramoyl-pentapeptide-transferase [uncultured archaeon]|nr:Phospho-N-acetylmuramoyl-pentapeptide-transferase [uncultured archaeon]